MAQETPIEFTRQIDGFTNQRCGNEVVIGAGTAVVGHIILDASNAHIGQVGGATIMSDANFQRPNDANPYQIGDVVSNSTGATTMMTFDNVARVNGGSGWITAAMAYTDKKDSVQNLELLLFKVSTVTPAVDNAPDKTLWANRTYYVGTIDFGAFVPGTDAANSTGARAEPNYSVRIPFACDTNDDALYGYFRTKTASTPAAQQNFYVRLKIEDN